MITAALIRLSAALLCVTGLTDGSDVSQTPLLWRNQSQSATMNCSHTKDITYRQMYWYRQLPGEGMKQIVFTTPGSAHQYEKGFSQDKFPATKNDALTGSLTVEKLLSADSGVYFCAVSGQYTGGGLEAHFGGGTKLTVLDRETATPVVKVLKPSTKECKNSKENKKKKTLVCVATFYPDHVSVFWQINGENVTKGVATDNFARRDNETKLYKITSRLRVDAKEWFSPSNTFECLVSFFDGTDTQTYKGEINGEPAPDTGNTLTREVFLKRSQAGKLCYGVFIVKSSLYGAFVAFLVWKLQGSARK